ncbi:MAG: SUMF1/EgtB/PvdO family nonheme iron enzyme [Planctomycetes bacterium]|nr:SUMF1/EgtB/PvdO family nonheme iron enzyme [Planctomycetota bacterium]
MSPSGPPGQDEALHVDRETLQLIRRGLDWMNEHGAAETNTGMHTWTCEDIRSIAIFVPRIRAQGRRAAARMIRSVREKCRMDHSSELQFGLLAHQLKVVSNEQLLEAVAAWLNDLNVACLVPGHPARNLPGHLAEIGHLSPESLETVEAARAAQASDPPSVDSGVRQALLDLHPPPELRKWLFEAPVRKGAALEFQPRVRGERYELGAEIARGGLGRVVEARDRHLERNVAIKLVLDGVSRDLAERFVREARLAARLDHPNIVPVYDFDELSTPEGERRLFMSMKRIRGQDLGAVLRGLSAADGNAAGRFSRARLLAIFQDICLGIAFAHSRGVVHRDLKPSNIMIGDYGETLIVDWGLAKLAGETARETGSPESGLALSSPELTLEGEVVGTPAFMPPEQAGGRREEVDHRSDIFSLGGILYAILTHRPPFEGTSQRDVIEKVKSGRIEPPSIRVHSLRRANPHRDPAPSAPEPVPPELDAICMKAMAFRTKDRYQTATELHDDIQLFLEGVKERGRKQKEALDRIAKGRSWVLRFRELRGEITAQEKAVREWSDRIKPCQPIGEKRPLLDAEARLRALKEERIDAFSRASAEFGQALAVDPESKEAADARCDLFLDRLLEAEQRRFREDVLLYRNMLIQSDTEGRYRRRLEAPGTLAIRTFTRDCECLRPIRDPAWRVEISESCTVAWRGGRPRPGVPLTDMDNPVPEVRTFPDGVRFGHSEECLRREVAGVEVSIARYEEVDKRLALGPERVLGITPLAGIELPRGSWLCVLRGAGFPPVRLPVWIERGGSWIQEVNLYREDEIPPGTCLVPGGPFTFGGRWAGGRRDEQVRIIDDFFMAKFPVTCAEYLEFLNDLVSTGRAEEARRRQPREGEKKYWIADGARFRLPSPAEDPRIEWNPGCPVFSIDWFDSVAYCMWKSRRDGVTWELMHEEEYEKACRGVDGRVFSFGNEYDGSYAHTSESIAGKLTPMPVGSFPMDESPYGIRDLSGGVESWGSSTPELPWREWRILRGGAWSYPFEIAQSAQRRGSPPTALRVRNGVRLILRPHRV